MNRKSTIKRVTFYKKYLDTLTPMDRKRRRLYSGTPQVNEVNLKNYLIV